MGSCENVTSDKKSRKKTDFSVGLVLTWWRQIMNHYLTNQLIYAFPLITHQKLPLNYHYNGFMVETLTILFYLVKISSFDCDSITPTHRYTYIFITQLLIAKLNIQRKMEPRKFSLKTGLFVNSKAYWTIRLTRRH